MSDRTTNIRVYGIILNDKKQVLLSDEFRFGRQFTKFPGGGLEWGEGTKDCLKRELYEEMKLEAEIGDLFYVNDFMQISAFRENDQLFSFYYFVNQIEFERIMTVKRTPPLTEDGEKFRWLDLSDLSSESVTFPVDKIVAEKLIEKCK